MARRSTALADIPKAHKIAVRSASAGERAEATAWPIGRATPTSAVGDQRTSTMSRPACRASRTSPTPRPTPNRARAPPAGTFLGYHRKNGRVGTRNEIWVLCTVGCVANTARRIAEKANAPLRHGRVDGVFAFPTRSAVRGWATT